MFDQLTMTQRRLTLESYQSRRAELTRRLEVLARSSPDRGNAQRDFYELNRLIELIQQPPKPRTIVPSTVEGYLAAMD